LDHAEPENLILGTMNFLCRFGGNLRGWKIREVLEIRLILLDSDFPYVRIPNQFQEIPRKKTLFTVS
jgi:hypothetical protein